MKLFFLFRVGWLALTALFVCLALSVCINQVARFVLDPFAFTVEVNKNDGTYSVPTYTICTDEVKSGFIDEYYKRSEHVTSIDPDSKTYSEYNHYMRIIGRLNVEDIHLINDFEKTKLFKNLSGYRSKCKNNFVNHFSKHSNTNVCSMIQQQKYLDRYSFLTGNRCLFPVLTEAGLCWSNMKMYKYFKVMENIDIIE